MMSESERANFLKAAVSRAPGKRQIKPSAAVFEGEAGALDDDEDDEDFLAGDEGSDEDDNASSDRSNSETNASSSDENEDDDADESSDTDEVQIIEPDSAAIVPSSSKMPPTEQLICSICMNLKGGMKNAEVIQCDRCGLAVHELCYAVEDPPDNVSETSSASTEPWYCEPCMLGVSRVPHCELCPSRYGAFKKANVEGCWVHLLCALYTPGISFGDVDHLTAVSWQEMDPRQFGRRECFVCADKLSARTGTTVQCEAGLCKNFYHVTCAQRLGLLMDSESDEHSAAHHAALERGGGGHIDFNFLLCKRHNHSDSARSKKDAYAKFIRQENRRLASFNRLKLSDRQEVKRRKQYEGYLSRMKDIEAFVTPHQTKRTRMLHSSNRLLTAFAEKAERIGVDAKQFEQEFLSPPGEQIFVIPPAFSVHFIRYFQHREEVVFQDEQERLEYTRKERDTMLEELKTMECDLKTLKERKTKIQDQAKASTTLLTRLTNALVGWAVPKKHLSIQYPEPMAKLNNPLRSAQKPVEPTTKEKKRSDGDSGADGTLKKSVNARKRKAGGGANGEGSGVFENANKRRKPAAGGDSLLPSSKTTSKQVVVTQPPDATAARATKKSDSSIAGLVVDNNDNYLSGLIYDSANCDSDNENSSLESTSDGDSTRVFVCSADIEI